MKFFAPSVENLIDEFAKLPGIGRKSAQRLAFHVLNQSKEEAQKFADAIIKAKETVHTCPKCFTLVFGLVIIGLSMLIPFAGGAEKVVVMLLTMIMCPLYIPSIWGLFSRRLTGKQLIFAMILTWAVGITAKLTVPASVLSQSLIESISGCVLPVIILAIMEIWSRMKGVEDPGYEVIADYTDPEADKEPDAKMKKSVKSYSFMAISCFCITLGVIALLLLGLIIAGDPKTLAVKNIVWSFIASIAVLITSYIVYRVIDSKKTTE